MESNKLTVLESSVPLKAIPNIDDILNTQFKYFISNLLSIKADKEESLDNALPAVKEQFTSLGMKEVVQAFTMYADSKLNIKPKSNYIDRILVGQVFSAYKEYQRSLNKPHPEPTKDEKDYFYCVTAYDHYHSTGTFYIEMSWIYEYLEDYKKVIKWSEEHKKKAYNHFKTKYDKDRAIKESKCHLIIKYFDSIKSKGLHIKDII